MIIDTQTHTHTIIFQLTCISQLPRDSHTLLIPNLSILSGKDKTFYIIVDTNPPCLLQCYVFVSVCACPCILPSVHDVFCILGHR